MASGEAFVDPGDLVDNSVTIAGDLISVVDLTTPTGQSEQDTSHAWSRVPPTSFAKTVYAFNGSTAGQPLPATTLVTAGDTLRRRTIFSQSFVPLRAAALFRSSIHRENCFCEY